ncbi:MAG: hypothetical protein Q9217_004042 [Psora testacea]
MTWVTSHGNNEYRGSLLSSRVPHLKYNEEVKRLFKHKIALNSTTTSLDASANVPVSGFAFVNNSQGASASIVELSNVLDGFLGDIESETRYFPGEASDFPKLEIRRLDDEVSKYSNSRFIADANHPMWSWLG